jgi:hypothetical protein
MFRLLPLAIVASCLPAAVAAPVPKDAQGREAVLRTFGTPTDPTKEAEFAVEGRKLVVRLPKPMPRVRTRMDFPHTAREASGDFVLQVKLSYPLSEKVPALGAGLCAAGGIYIADGSGDHVLFHCGHQPCGLADGTTRWDANFFIEYSRADRPQHHQNNTGEREGLPVYLRLTREKGVVTPAYSYDGKKWTSQQSGPMKLPEKVTVGVYALQTSGQPTAVTFEGLTVTPVESK